MKLGKLSDMHAICLAIYLPVNVSVSLVPSMTTPLLMAMATLHLPVKIFFTCSFRYLAPLLVFLSHVCSCSLSLHLPSVPSHKYTNTYLQRTLYFLSLIPPTTLPYYLSVFLFTRLTVQFITLAQLLI